MNILPQNPRLQCLSRDASRLYKFQHLLTLRLTSESPIWPTAHNNNNSSCSPYPPRKETCSTSVRWTKQEPTTRNLPLNQQFVLCYTWASVRRTKAHHGPCRWHYSVTHVIGLRSNASISGGCLHPSAIPLSGTASLWTIAITNVLVQQADLDARNRRQEI
jgi:hypothetical protein